MISLQVCNITDPSESTMFMYECIHMAATVAFTVPRNIRLATCIMFNDSMCCMSKAFTCRVDVQGKGNSGLLEKVIAQLMTSFLPAPTMEIPLSSLRRCIVSRFLRIVFRTFCCVFVIGCIHLSVQQSSHHWNSL